MTGLTIAKWEDASVCTRIFVDVFSNPPWEYPWITDEKSGRYIEDIFRSPGFLGFLYYQDDRLAGFCIGSINDYFFDPQYEIKELAIRVESQRQGTGSKMLLEIEQNLAQNGVTLIFLHTSRTIPAYRFYIKNGYAPVDDNVYFMKEI